VPGYLPVYREVVGGDEVLDEGEAAELKSGDGRPIGVDVGLAVTAVLRGREGALVCVYGKGMD